METRGSEVVHSPGRMITTHTFRAAVRARAKDGVSLACVFALLLVAGLLLPVGLPVASAQISAIQQAAQRNAAPDKDAAKPGAGTDKPPATPPAELPIPTAEIAPRVEPVLSQLRGIEQGSGEATQLQAQRAEVESIEADANRLLMRTDSVLRQSVSLDTLRELDVGWQDLDRRANAIVRELTRRLGVIDRALADLDRTQKQWSKTLESARADQAPQEVLERVQQVIRESESTRVRVQQGRAALLALQNRAGALSNRASDTRSRIERSQDSALDRLFVLDAQPLWRSTSDIWTRGSLLQSSGESLGARWNEAVRYLLARPGAVALAFIVFALLTWTIYRLRAVLRRSQVDEPQLVGVAMAVERPAAVAALLVGFAITVIFGAAPSLLLVLVAMMLAIPAAGVIARTMPRSFRPIIWSMLGLFLVDQLRQLSEGLQAQAAISFIFECLLIMAVSAWLARRAPELPLVAAPHHVSAHRYIVFMCRVGVIASGLSLMLYVIGLTALATLIVRAFVLINYAAVLRYAMSRIGEGLLTTLLRARPFILLATVRNHRTMLVERGTRLLDLVLFVSWIYYSLDALSLARPIWQWIVGVATVEIGTGPYKLSLWGLAVFFLTVAASWLASRAIKLLLDEEVYPRVELPRGIPYAMNSIIHYLLMFFGTMAAVSAMGIDLSRFTVLTGAFGVGLGLGLQGVVNNFVSGLLMLFERPLKVGDMIQLDDTAGRVDRIGIRATVIRMGNGAEAIVPNAKLFSERVTNWTLSSRLRRLDVAFTANLGADPAKISDMLLEAVRAVEGVSTRPEPQLLLTKMGPEALEFSLQAWTEEAQRWPRIQSEILMMINSRLRNAGIALK